MVIKREINGKEVTIELTSDELYNAYCEQEHAYDVMDVEDMFENMTDGDFAEHGITREYAESKEDMIAYQKRRYMTKYDMDWEYALDKAMNDFLEECESEKYSEVSRYPCVTGT